VVVAAAAVVAVPPPLTTTLARVRVVYSSTMRGVVVPCDPVCVYSMVQMRKRYP